MWCQEKWYTNDADTSSQRKEHAMQIMCATEQAASQVLLLFMSAHLWPTRDYTFPHTITRLLPIAINLLEPQDATMRTTIAQIPDTKITLE